MHKPPRSFIVSRWSRRRTRTRRMNGYAVARQNGWMSANDIRELENLDRIPEELGGDLYLVNGSMTKLSEAGAFVKTAQENQEETEESK